MAYTVSHAGVLAVYGGLRKALRTSTDNADAGSVLIVIVRRPGAPGRD